LQCRLIGQQFVEVRALDLKGRWLALGECVAEIKGAVVLAPGKRGAGFQLETGCIHRIEHAGFFDEVQAMGQQAFADGKARKMLAFDDQHIMPFALEQRGGDGARRAGANDHNLATFQFNGWHEGSLPGRRRLWEFDACRSGPAAVWRPDPSTSAQSTAPG